MRFELCKCGHKESVHNTPIDSCSECDCLEYKAGVVYDVTVKNNTVYCMSCGCQTDQKLCRTCRAIGDRLCAEAEDILGMGKGAWDMEEGAEIVMAVLKAYRKFYDKTF